MSVSRLDCDYRELPCIRDESKRLVARSSASKGDSGKMAYLEGMLKCEE